MSHRAREGFPAPRGICDAHHNQALTMQECVWLSPKREQTERLEAGSGVSRVRRRHRIAVASVGHASGSSEHAAHRIAQLRRRLADLRVRDRAAPISANPRRVGDRDARSHGALVCAGLAGARPRPAIASPRGASPSGRLGSRAGPQISQFDQMTPRCGTRSGMSASVIRRSVQRTRAPRSISR